MPGCSERQISGLATFTSDSRPAIAKINKPTLIVGATKDLVPQFQEMQKSIPGARFELFEDAGHALFVDGADKFNNLLDEFLTSLNEHDTTRCPTAPLRPNPPD